jgi:hypothetical protein
MPGFRNRELSEIEEYAEEMERRRANFRIAEDETATPPRRLPSYNSAIPAGTMPLTAFRARRHLGEITQMVEQGVSRIDHEALAREQRREEEAALLAELLAYYDDLPTNTQLLEQAGDDIADEDLVAAELAQAVDQFEPEPETEAEAQAQAEAETEFEPNNIPAGPPPTILATIQPSVSFSSEIDEDGMMALLDEYERELQEEEEATDNENAFEF